MHPHTWWKPIQLILCNVVPLRENCDYIKSFISIRLGAGQHEVFGSAAAAAASPGNLLEMKVPGPGPQSTKLEVLWVGPSNLCFNRLS